MSSALRKETGTRVPAGGSVFVKRDMNSGAYMGTAKSIDKVRMPDGSTVHIVDKDLFDRAVRNAMAHRNK